MSGKACPKYTRSGGEPRYLEFELGRETLLEVKTLARKTGCTPFQMCVSLLQEGLSSKSKGGRAAARTPSRLVLCA